MSILSERTVYKYFLNRTAKRLIDGLDSVLHRIGHITEALLKYIAFLLHVRLSKVLLSLVWLLWTRSNEGSPGTCCRIEIQENKVLVSHCASSQNDIMARGTYLR